MMWFGLLSSALTVILGAVMLGGESQGSRTDPSAQNCMDLSYENPGRGEMPSKLVACILVLSGRLRGRVWVTVEPLSLRRQ